MWCTSATSGQAGNRIRKFRFVCLTYHPACLRLDLPWRLAPTCSTAAPDANRSPLPQTTCLHAVGAVVVLFALSWRLAPICSIVIVCTGLAAAAYRKFTRVVEQNQGQALQQMTGVALQALENMKTVRWGRGRRGCGVRGMARRTVMEAGTEVFVQNLCFYLLLVGYSYTGLERSGIYVFERKRIRCRTIHITRPPSVPCPPRATPPPLQVAWGRGVRARESRQPFCLFLTPCPCPSYMPLPILPTCAGRLRARRSSASASATTSAPPTSPASHSARPSPGSRPPTAAPSMRRSSRSTHGAAGSSRRGSCPCGC